jgi:hypothetical protein
LPPLRGRGSESGLEVLRVAIVAGQHRRVLGTKLAGTPRSSACGPTSRPRGHSDFCGFVPLKVLRGHEEEWIAVLNEAGPLTYFPNTSVWV